MLHTTHSLPYGGLCLGGLPDRPPWTETPQAETLWTETPWTENPLGHRPPWTEIPLDTDPPGWRPPGQRQEPPSPVDRQTSVKT